MNKGSFIGRLAKAPVFRDGGRTPVCFFTLIRNEYAGKDEVTGDAREERKVAIPFTIFGSRAKTISEHAYVGDQIVVEYRLVNNDREVQGEIEYGFSFIVDDFEFGAPGETKRQKLSQQQQRG